jgi:hypothetical protein
MGENLTQNVIVISVSQYVIKDEKTGKIENQGCTVRYAFTENLEPFEDKEKSIKGYKPAKTSLSYDDYAKFPTVPAIYQATLGYSVDSAGKAAIAVKDFKFLNAITVSKASNKNSPKFGT